MFCFQLQKAVNSLDHKGELPLEVALKTRQPSLARILVEHGADLNAKDLKGLSLLQAAIFQGDAYSAEFLIEQLKNSDEQLCEPVKITRSLCNIKYPEELEGCTVLHLVTKHNSESMLAIGSRLLQAGIDPNLRNNNGWYDLLNYSLFAILTFTITVFYVHRTALHSCVWEKNEPLFDILLECQSIDLDETTDEDDTPLCIAMRKDPFGQSFAKKLLSKGATSNPVYRNTGDTLLHVLTRECKEEAALFLIDYCKDNLMKRNHEGYTVLHEACKVGLKNLTRALLEKDFSVNVVTFTGDAPIHFAVSNLYFDIVLELLNVSDSISQLNLRNDENETPLSLAIKAPLKKGKDIVLALIKAGANINQCNEEGLTLLHQAILKEDSATAIFLLENGADMNAR